MGAGKGCMGGGAGACSAAERAAQRSPAADRPPIHGGPAGASHLEHREGVEHAQQLEQHLRWGLLWGGMGEAGRSGIVRDARPRVDAARDRPIGGHAWVSIMHARASPCAARPRCKGCTSQMQTPAHLGGDGEVDLADVRGGDLDPGGGGAPLGVRREEQVAQHVLREAHLQEGWTEAVLAGQCLCPTGLSTALLLSSPLPTIQLMDPTCTRGGAPCPRRRFPRSPATRAGRL